MTEPVTGDAFGDLLRRCWAGGGAPGRAIEIVERDDGFIGAAMPPATSAVPTRGRRRRRRSCRTPGAVAVCHARGLDAGVADIDHLPDGPLDTLLLFGNNLGRARILGSAADPYRTVDPVHTAYHARNREHGRPGGQLRLRVRHANVATDWFEYWLLTVAELEAVLDRSPWRMEAVAQGPDTDPNDAVALTLRG